MSDRIKYGNCLEPYYREIYPHFYQVIENSKAWRLYGEWTVGIASPDEYIRDDANRRFEKENPKAIKELVAILNTFTDEWEERISKQSASVAQRIIRDYWLHRPTGRN